MNSINENESENMLIYDAEMCQYASLFDEIGHQLTRISNAYEDDIHDIEMCNLASVYDDLNQQLNQIGSAYDDTTSQELNNLNLSTFEFLPEIEQYLIDDKLCAAKVKPIDITDLLINVDSFDFNSDIMQHFIHDENQARSPHQQWGGSNPSLYILQRELNRDFHFGLSYKSLEFISNNPQVNNFMHAKNLCRNFIDLIYSNHITPIKRYPKISIMIHHDSFTHAINTT